MASEILAEEFEVLESIYPTELSKLSPSQIEILVEPDDLPDGLAHFVITLRVDYPPNYPDVLPQLSFQDASDSDPDHDNSPDTPQLSPQEQAEVMQELISAANDNLGMAMTFALVSTLKDKLSQVLKTRVEQERQAEAEKERKALEAEEARTRGTPVTIESFTAWKAKFDAEQKKLKADANDAYLKGLGPKEREEWKKITTRLTGRQLFMKNQDLDEDLEGEEGGGGESVDVTLYDRQTNVQQDELEEDIVTFSDSD